MGAFLLCTFFCTLASCTQTPSSEQDEPSLLSVTTQTEILAHKVIYQDTDTLFLGQESVLVQGADGFATYEIEHQNVDGVTVVINQREIDRQEPIDTVILRGTKPNPVPTGTFRYPISSVITSYYGWRTLNGQKDFHYGIDLRAAVGTPIRATDGGIVSYVGTPTGVSASYGKLIIIDHQNGFRSYYAHLSRFDVKVGDAVYQGQVIGKTGVTGNITGPHLHFEIRKNNLTQNPLHYLK